MIFREGRTQHEFQERLLTSKNPNLKPTELGSPRIVAIGQVLCVVIPLAIWFAPINLDPTAKHGLAITTFMVIAWITQAMEYAVAGLIGCFLFWALKVAS